MAQIILDKLQKKFSHAIISTHNRFGNETAVVNVEDIVSICEFLRDDPDLDMSMIMDITCVDWPEDDERFEVVYHAYSIAKKHRVRLKVRVSETSLKINTVTTVWSGADWFEREVYDMYGVIFEGHHNLKRILLYPEFQGFPLRKDYPIDKRQPLVENRQRNTNYGIQGISGDPITAGDPTIVQIGQLKTRS